MTQRPPAKRESESRWNCIPLVFIFLGTELPPYVVASLSLARQHNRVPILFLADSSHQGAICVPDVKFVPLEDFYDPTVFEKMRSRIVFDHNFRGGFWLKTFERLFVLQQFMRTQEFRAVLHAELDQLLFGVEDLIDSLERLPMRGTFFPFHKPDKAVASVLYSNDEGSLEALLDGSGTNIYNNEMELLRAWAIQSPSSFSALPTLANDLLGREATLPPQVDIIEYETLGGYVDAAELGLWVGGRDPRNLPILTKPTNHFVYSEKKRAMDTGQLERLFFSYSTSSRSLSVMEGEQGFSRRLYNLHLHSKIHRWLWRNDPTLQGLLTVANAGFSSSFPGTRRHQIYSFMGERVWLRIRRRISLGWRKNEDTSTIK